MENFDRLSVLLQKRITIKEHITSFQEFLARLDISNPTQVAELKIRYDTIYACLSNLDEMCDEIQLIDAETDHSLEKKSIQDLCFHTLAQAQAFVETTLPLSNPNENTSVRESVANAENGNGSTVSTNYRKLKLPQAVLPTFSGRVEEWLSFKDTFYTMIHKRDDIANVEKLQYLKSVLKDEALRKIQVLSITDDNYERAWNLLQRSYEDKRLLISRHLSLLLRLPVQERECYKGLIALADESQQHIQSLATLGVDVNPEMIVAIIEEKLHKATSEKWDETVKKGEFPKLEDLTDFLYRTAARISKRKGDHPSHGEHAEKGSPSFKKRKIVYNRQAFVTSTTKKCPLCSEFHMLFKCGKFLTLTVNERFKVVKNASLCFNCLRNHPVKGCKFGTCKKCGKRHNTLLHFSKSPDQTASTVA